MRGRNPDLKIIFVSGYAEDAFEKSLPENQQFAFLPKPFTLSQLVATVKETMAPSVDVSALGARPQHPEIGCGAIVASPATEGRSRGSR